MACIVSTSAAFATERAGDQAVDRGEYRVAVRAYEAALAEEPDDVDVLVKLARTKTRMAGELPDSEAGQLLEEAAGHALRATEIAPESAEAHFERARALGTLAQFRGILENLGLAAVVRSALEQTLELDADHAGALHALALWHFNVPWIVGGRTGEIAPLFERAIELEPENPSHRRAYGEILLALGEREAAREQLERAVAIEDETFVGRFEQERARELLFEHF